jgi:hypothetical protein
MHIQGEEEFTFNRLIGACYQVRGGMGNVNLIMKYFNDRELLRECYIGGGTDLRHKLRVPKHYLWEAHHRRGRDGKSRLGTRLLKEICGTYRVPNQRFWAKSHYPGGVGAILALAYQVQAKRADAGFANTRRNKKEEPTHQYLGREAVAETLIDECVGRRQAKTIEQVTEALFGFMLRNPENCRKLPKTLAQLHKRVEGVLISMRRPNVETEFERGGQEYYLEWEHLSTGTKSRPMVHWLEPV